MARIMCCGCRTLLMYNQGAASVRCSCCHTINGVRPGFSLSLSLIKTFGIVHKIPACYASSLLKKCWFYECSEQQHGSGADQLRPLPYYTNVSLWCAIRQVCSVPLHYKYWGMLQYLCGCMRI